MATLASDQRPEEWYAVRLVLQRLDAGEYMELKAGEHVYEETIRLVRASSYDESLEIAEKIVTTEAKEFGDFAYTGYAEGFKLFDELENGAEVYTTLRKSKLESEGYIKKYLRTGQEVGFANEFDSDAESTYG